MKKNNNNNAVIAERNTLNDQVNIKEISVL